MRQYRDDLQPKARPRGYAPTDRQFQSRPRQRPAPPRARVDRPKGPARIPPKQPVSAKQRRRMLKAAAWRLAKIIYARPAALLALDLLALEDLVDRECRQRLSLGDWGDAVRLAAKIARLRT